jgi:hypothetical protein
MLVLGKDRLPYPTHLLGACTFTDKENMVVRVCHAGGPLHVLQKGPLSILECYNVLYIIQKKKDAIIHV